MIGPFLVSVPLIILYLTITVFHVLIRLAETIVKSLGVETNASLEFGSREPMSTSSMAVRPWLTTLWLRMIKLWCLDLLVMLLLREGVIIFV